MNYPQKQHQKPFFTLVSPSVGMLWSPGACINCRASLMAQVLAKALKSFLYSKVLSILPLVLGEVETSLRRGSGKDNGRTKAEHTCKNSIATSSPHLISELFTYGVYTAFPLDKCAQRGCGQYLLHCSWSRACTWSYMGDCQGSVF